MGRHREVVAEDHIRQSPPIEIGAADDGIETVPSYKVAEMELEAFMQEPVVVYIAESTDENAVPMVEVSVNGRKVFIPRGKNTTIKRMHLERLALAKKTAYSQNLDPRLGEGINELRRHRALDYPFSVIQDTDRGREWLTRLLAQT